MIPVLKNIFDGLLLLHTLFNSICAAVLLEEIFHFGLSEKLRSFAASVKKSTEPNIFMTLRVKDYFTRWTCFKLLVGANKQYYFSQFVHSNKHNSSLMLSLPEVLLLVGISRYLSDCPECLVLLPFTGTNSSPASVILDSEITKLQMIHMFRNVKMVISK